MLTSGMLNLMPESVFVLVVILLVMLALHALAVMAAFACRLVYGINGYNCFSPATSRLFKSFSWALLTTRLVSRLACRTKFFGVKTRLQAFCWTVNLLSAIAVVSSYLTPHPGQGVETFASQGIMSTAATNTNPYFDTRAISTGPLATSSFKGPIYRQVLTMHSVAPGSDRSVDSLLPQGTRPLTTVRNYTLVTNIIQESSPIAPRGLELLGGRTFNSVNTTDHGQTFHAMDRLKLRYHYTILKANETSVNMDELSCHSSLQLRLHVPGGRGVDVCTSVDSPTIVDSYYTVLDLLTGLHAPRSDFASLEGKELLTKLMTALSIIAWLWGGGQQASMLCLASRSDHLLYLCTDLHHKPLLIDARYTPSSPEVKEGTNLRRVRGNVKLAEGVGIASAVCPTMAAVGMLWVPSQLAGTGLALTKAWGTIEREWSVTNGWTNGGRAVRAVTTLFFDCVPFAFERCLKGGCMLLGPLSGLETKAALWQLGDCGVPMMSRNGVCEQGECDPLVHTHKEAAAWMAMGASIDLLRWGIRHGVPRKLRRDLVYVAVCGLIDLKLLDRALEVEVLPMSWTSRLWDNRSLLGMAQVSKDKIESFLGCIGRPLKAIGLAKAWRSEARPCVGEWGPGDYWWGCLDYYWMDAACLPWKLTTAAVEPALQSNSLKATLRRLNQPMAKPLSLCMLRLSLKVLVSTVDLTMRALQLELYEEGLNTLDA